MTPFCRALAGRIFTVCALLCAAPGHAATLQYKTGPAPDWVVPVISATSSRKPNSAVHGVEALLVDRQTRLGNAGAVSFVHIATRAVTSAGVDASANISMDFEPTYQTVTLHAITLVRDGVRIDKLPSARIGVLQRERELEYRLYDGRKTVNVDLEDVRVGDVIDYAYSVSGQNPVFDNKLSGVAELQFAIPVDHIFARLVAPLERPLHLANHNHRLAPAVTEAGGLRDYRWDLIGMPGLRVEKDAPGGFDPQASVQWSEFDNWGAVVKWALPLYRHGAPGPAVQAEVARIAAASAEPSQRLRAVLRLVQRDIRYLGVEIGASTHAPASPDVVFRRRFGDCKDKATLVVAMLSALNIDAAPALVHTDKVLATAQPSVNAFNHVIVRARVDHTTYWIDPTRGEQQGDLAHLDQPDYGMALVLADATSALERMNTANANRRSIRASFDLRGKAEAPVRYIVSTTMTGADADRMRERLASVGSADIEKEYLNYYAHTYPGISNARTLEVKDDQDSNILVLTEHYDIADFWQRSEGKKRLEAWVGSAEIRSRLSAPDLLKRIAPLRLPYPEEVVEVTEVLFSEPFDLENEAYTVRDPAFEFQHKSVPASDRRSLVLTDRYRALADRVQPDAVAIYAGRTRAALDKLGTTLYRGAATRPAKRNTEFKAHVEWRAVLATVLGFSAILFSLLMHTSPKGHHQTDRKLLRAYIGIALTLVIVLALLSRSGHMLLAALAALYALHLATRTISAKAPASHWIYPLAHPDAISLHSTFFNLLAHGLRILPALLVAACALLLVLRF